MKSIFVFYAFCSGMDNVEQICEQEFERWLTKGYRGPGHLKHYINNLENYLDKRDAKINISESGP